MLKYLIVQLDDTSTSFCHYKNENRNSNLIPLDALKDAIFWAMKENLTLQVLFPDYEISEEYKEIISEIDHAKIVPAASQDKETLLEAEVVVFNSVKEMEDFALETGKSYILRIPVTEFLKQQKLSEDVLSKVDRLNIMFTDIPAFTSNEEEKYKEALSTLAEQVFEQYKSGHPVQVNLLTDRMLLEKMNNCNAGDESVTLAPDGKFYICPAFYCNEKESSISDIKSGLDIKNPQLYKLHHAPICRKCDAWQCKRCIWLNRKTTLEVNTPSREQCVMAHIERNASRELLSRIRTIGEFLPGREIKEIDYLDPFDIIKS
ncbi:MAG: CXXX repeat peptide maturase [Muribaculaceae bacterium]|nr:CXXX repeat peptide maturase [Muribaculaceae bacterium]